MALTKSNKEKINDALVLVSRKDKKYNGETLVDGLTKGRELKLLNEQLEFYTARIEKFAHIENEPSRPFYTKMVKNINLRIDILTK